MWTWTFEVENTRLSEHRSRWGKGVRVDDGQGLGFYRWLVCEKKLGSEKKLRNGERFDFWIDKFSCRMRLVWGVKFNCRSWLFCSYEEHGRRNWRRPWTERWIVGWTRDPWLDARTWADWQHGGEGPPSMCRRGRGLTGTNAIVDAWGILTKLVAHENESSWNTTWQDV